MKLKLIHKLSLAMFICTALVLVLTSLVTRVSIGKGFADFLQHQERSLVQPLVAELANWYSDRDSWDDMVSNPNQFYNLMYSVLPQERNAGPGDGTGRPPPMRTDRRGQGFQGPREGRQPGPRGPRGVPGAGPRGRNALPQRVYLLDDDRSTVIGVVPAVVDEGKLLPIEVKGSTVGWLGIASVRRINLPEEDAFITKLRNIFLIGSGMGLAVAVILAWLLARHLSRPVNEVAEGIRGLASGNFKNRVDIHGSDEIANLGYDLNRLSTALGEHETARKRWMTDMAHELRTPLAIISGELEAMSDGVRPLDKHQLDSVRDEVKHLSTLVNDLHSLALTDAGALAYKMQFVDFRNVVQMAVESSRGRAMKKGLELDSVIPEKPVEIWGDEQRLRQLLGNLLDNAVRYTDAPGRIAVELATDNQQARLSICDTAPGASEEECGHLFERLYRMELSRNRNSGGSGLGLAICHNIVDAHGGKISAKPGPDGGLMITAVLPLGK